MKGKQMASRKVHHNIMYWCDYILVVKITTYSEKGWLPHTAIVYGGTEDVTEAECLAYIAGANAWMEEELRHEES